MKSLILLVLVVAVAHVPALFAQSSGARQGPRITTANGIVEGIESNGVRIFKGIPFAAPPIRQLRWKPPQPVTDWKGVRKADRFAAQCMQQRVFGDMMFRNSGVSEDCLYLNVWTPADAPGGELPVLVYYYGGGFVAGDGSEPRYDGANMARERMVVVTMSYRLGVFGFFAHPELTAESPHGASGNYTLMDQAQVLRWVQENIAAFGGDPERVTIAGESAGSFSVSAQMASPLSRNLIAGAIGESGSLLGSRALASRTEGERNGVAFANAVGVSSLAALRAMSAMELLGAAGRPGMPRFRPIVDGYFFPGPPVAIFEARKQAQVPLLVGWNSEEMSYRFLLGPNDPTMENFERAVRGVFGEHAEEALGVYAPAAEQNVVRVATDLAGDQFIAYSTWKWAELHSRTSDAPVYRYFYAHPRPPMRQEIGNATPDIAGGVIGDGAAGAPPPPTGAVHSAEIEYAMGNLDANPIYAWTDEDYRVSDIVQGYFANFVETGNPNGPGLPKWPLMKRDPDAPVMQMRLDVESRGEPAPHRDRYLFLDRFYSPSSP